MATLVSEIITDAQNELIDYGVFMSATELLRLYNKGAWNFGRETRCYRRLATLTTVAGSAVVALPADCIGVLCVLWNSPDNTGKPNWRLLSPRGLMKLVLGNNQLLSTHADHRSDPTEYAVLDTNIRLNVPVLTSSSSDLAVFYVARPATQTVTTATTEIPDELTEAITEYIIWKSLKKEREFNDAAEAKRTYEEWLGKGRAWVKRRIATGWNLDIALPGISSFAQEINPF